jgi:hypothetical protein
MAKVVKMLAKISGTRNGVDWPDVGETYELPDDEADQLVGQKLAKPAKRDSNTYKSADGIDHGSEVQAANAAAKAAAAAAAAPTETTDDEESANAESTVLTTGKGK